jgi:hypothetical protein
MIDFLRTSRSTIDDSINQNLNAIPRLSRLGFDPLSTQSRQNSTSPPHPNRIPASSCDQFVSTVLFPSWAVRDDVIKYCLEVALSPVDDRSDPLAQQRYAEDEAARQRKIDERLDPYSGRYFPQKLRKEALLDLLQNEVAVEKIIRDRTKTVIEERCVDANGKADLRTYAAWKRQRDEKENNGGR